MKPRTLTVTVSSACSACCCARASPASAAKPQDQSSQLFVQQTGGGELTRFGPGTYRLVLRGISPTVATFTDRPRRRAGQKGLTRFVRRWANNGFAADPKRGARRRRRAQLPRCRDADPLPPPLQPSRRDPDLQREAAARLGAASLFVDDAGSAVRCVPMNFQVTSTINGEQVARLDPRRRTLGFRPPPKGSTGFAFSLFRLEVF